MESNPGCGHCTGVELPLGPDVEGPSSECNRDSEPNQYERNRANQCGRAEGVPGAERSAPESCERGPGIVAHEGQSHSEEEQPEYYCSECPGQTVHPTGSRSIMFPISSREVLAGASVSIPRFTTTTR